MEGLFLSKENPIIINFLILLAGIVPIVGGYIVGQVKTKKIWLTIMIIDITIIGLLYFVIIFFPMMFVVDFIWAIVTSISVSIVIDGIFIIISCLVFADGKRKINSSKVHTRSGKRINDLIQE